MNTLPLTCFALALLAASSFAGEIYGTITQNGKPVGKDVAVTILIGGQSYSKPTDEFGSYRIFATESGKGTVKIAFTGQTISGDIESYSTPVRFDLAIENRGGHCRERSVAWISRFSLSESKTGKRYPGPGLCRADEPARASRKRAA
jgi:hypothetical protein